MESRKLAVAQRSWPQRVTGSLRFGRALAKINLRNMLAQRGSFWLQVFFMFLNNFMFLVTWWVLFERFDTIVGWQLRDLLALFGTSALAFGIYVTQWGGARDLGRVIEGGELDGYLTQPRSVLQQACTRRSVAMGFGDIISGFVLLGISGYLSLATLPWVLLVAVCGALLFLSTAVVIHSMVFWLQSGHAAARLFGDFIVIFASYPDPIFQGWVRVLLFTVLPAGWVAFWPVARLRQFAADGSSGELGVAALFLVATTLVYLSIARGVFRLGLRRYSSGNRAGVRVS